MNPENLEERTIIQKGIDIINACLGRIKTYNDFLEIGKVLRDFIEECYPKIKEPDVLAITSLISNWMKQDIHIKGYKNGKSNDSTHPYFGGIDGKTREDLLKTIISGEREYLTVLGNIY